MIPAPVVEAAWDAARVFLENAKVEHFQEDFALVPTAVEQAAP